MNQEFLFIILLIGIGYFFKKFHILKEQDGEALPVNQMFKYTILIGFLLPIGLSVIPYAHEFKFTTLRFIGTVSNLCVLISMVILFFIANVLI